MTKPFTLGILPALHTHLHRHKERDRTYLMPGMGGRALKRKQRMFLRWSLATGVAMSLLLGSLLIWLYCR